MELRAVFFYLIHHYLFLSNRILEDLSRRSPDISKVFDGQSIVSSYDRIVHIVDFYIIGRRLDVVIEPVILFIELPDFVDLLQVL